MTGEELRAFVAALARDRRRFTLEDAERQGDGGDGPWVAYLYDARPALTYRVPDYAAFIDRAGQGRGDGALPDAWAVREERPARNGGRDYSEEEAHITLIELARILARGDADADWRGTGRLRALHVRYADDGDDRYRVVVRTPAGDDREVTTLAAYLAPDAAR